MLPGETSAGFCRRMGWGPGTLIAGSEGSRRDILTITAVGEEAVLGIVRDRKPPREGLWTLRCRDWEVVSLPWMHLLRALLDGMEGEWPTYDDSGVRDACVVCSEPPETMCLLTEDGPVHLRHEVVDVLPHALVVEEIGHAQPVRLAGWEVAQLLIHPSGMTVRVLGEGTHPATSSTWLDAALTLWGYTAPTGWAAEVEALADHFDRRAS